MCRSPRTHRAPSNEETCTRGYVGYVCGKYGDERATRRAPPRDRATERETERENGEFNMFTQPRTHPIHRHRLPPSMGSFRQSQGTTALGRGEFPLVAVIRWESSRVVSDHANPPGLLDDEVLVVLLGAIEWCSRSLCRAVPRVGGR